MLGRTTNSNERGAAAVEMALVLPILLLLVFGIIEFGFIFNRYISVTHAAREGVRQLALGVEPADAELKAEQATGDVVSEDVSDAIACTASEDPAQNEVQMQCTTNYKLNLFVIDSTIGLSSTARMRKE
jgi:Flp pilus assembly protein TadG